MTGKITSAWVLKVLHGLESVLLKICSPSWVKLSLNEPYLQSIVGDVLNY